MAEEKKDEKLEFDLDAFNAQVDKEIDSLFVPVMGDLKLGEEPARADKADAGGGEGAPAPSGKKSAPSPDAPAFKTAPPPATHRADSAGPGSATDFAEKAGVGVGGFDLKAFEAQIDSTIDGLFVPSAPGVETGLEAENERRAAEREAAPSPEPGTETGGTADAGDGRVVPEAAPEETPDSEPARLLEALNVAHLSLDWEFSVENVSMLESALVDLEPYCRSNRETLSVYKMFRAVLKYLKARPESLDKRLIEFIRDAHTMLKALLFSGDRLGATEKEDLADLTRRFQAMGKKRTAKSEGAAAVPLVPPSRPVEGVATGESVPPPPLVEAHPAQSVTVSSPRPPEAMEKIHSTEDLRSWMESYGDRLGDIVKQFEAERNRLLHLMESMGKTPALNPVTTRLRAIDAGLDARISALGRMEREWSSRLRQSAGGLEEVTPALPTETPVPDEWGGLPPHGEAVASAAELEEPDRVDQFAETVVTGPAGARLPEGPWEERKDKDAPPEMPSIRRRASVYVFEISEKPVGVLAHHVVKIERIPVKKMDAILRRGFAVLDDFKGLFRGIKAGLLGDWAGLPKDTLKTFLFMPLTHEMLGIPSKTAVSKKAAAVLMSNGQQHGVVFSAFSGSNMRFETEIDESGVKDEFVLGRAEVASGTPIEVLDIDRLLKKLENDG